MFQDRYDGAQIGVHERHDLVLFSVPAATVDGRTLLWIVLFTVLMLLSPTTVPIPFVTSPHRLIHTHIHGTLTFVYGVHGEKFDC
jgi:hypothetical protein